MAGATVFTMNKTVVMDGRTLCCVLRDACCSAGVDQKHTVLIVDSTCVDNMGDWRDLVTVMSEGVWCTMYQLFKLFFSYLIFFQGFHLICSQPQSCLLSVESFRLVGSERQQKELNKLLLAK